MTNRLALSFEERKKKYATLKRVDNGSLRAGSPMYYYCRLCGAQMVLSETHTCAVPRYCTDCVGEGRGSNTAT